MITDHHASHYAHELIQADDTGVDFRCSRLFGARIGLYSRRIDEALLGVGLVFCQYWGEFRRPSIIVSSASFSKQWVLDLSEKNGVWHDYC